jgi:DNA helicase-4
VREQSIDSDQANERWDSVITILDGLARARKAETGKDSVVILARYHFELADRPNVDQFGNRLNIGWYTIHSSKGREADHIIVVGVHSDPRGGFPSAIADDRVLNLVMPGIEKYPHAEERRLLYVALTRAKKTVTLIADSTRPSAFLAELQKDFAIPFRECGGAEIDFRLCPRCGSALKQRKNRSTQVEFLGCNAFPACRYTEPLAKEAQGSHRGADAR